MTTAARIMINKLKKIQKNLHFTAHEVALILNIPLDPTVAFIVNGKLKALFLGPGIYNIRVNHHEVNNLGEKYRDYPGGAPQVVLDFYEELRKNWTVDDSDDFFDLWFWPPN